MQQGHLYLWLIASIEGDRERAVLAPSAEALLLAGRGEFEQAEALAQTAVARAETETDNVLFQAWTCKDLATVLLSAGRIDDARAASSAPRRCGSGSGAYPARTVSASRSTRSAGASLAVRDRNSTNGCCRHRGWR